MKNVRNCFGTINRRAEELEEGSMVVEVESGNQEGWQEDRDPEVEPDVMHDMEMKEFPGINSY